MVAGVHRLAVGIAGTVAHPHPPASAHDRVECRGHAAGGLAVDDLATLIVVRIRLAVRDHDQLVVAQALFDDLLQSLFVPHRSGTPQSLGPHPVFAFQGL